MIKEFQKIILNEFVELKTNKFLLAVSGGIDSMVLANCLLYTSDAADE